jgi:hypothetical protein
MELNAKIYVAGHNGMVIYISRKLIELGYTEHNYKNKKRIRLTKSF